MTVVQPAREVATLLSKGAPSTLRAVLWEIARAAARGGVPAVLVERLAEEIRQLLVIAYFAGGARAAQVAGQTAAIAADASEPFYEARIVPKVTFREAVADILARYPTLVPDQIREAGALAVQEWIGRLYADQGFALARATKATIVDRVQRHIANAVKGGLSKDRAIELILGESSGGGWTRNYAQVVFRNNVNTAYSAGVHRVARSNKEIGAIRYWAIVDGDNYKTRTGVYICRHFNGTLAPPDHDIWEQRTPPCHHNCRSGLRLLTWAYLERADLLSAGGRAKVYIPDPHIKPEPGFGGRRI